MSGSYSILQQPWWWDATALRGWEQAEVCRDGQVIARWPYMRMKGPPGVVLLGAPPLTNRAGPWVAVPEGKQSTRYARTGALLEQLVDQLPQFHWFAQNFHSSLDYWMPIFWRGYQMEARATYLIDDCSDVEKLERDLEESARRQLRKARKKLVIEEIGAAQLVDLVRMTFRRQGKGMRVAPAVIESVMAAISSRQAGRATAAVDAAGQVHASALFVWDDNKMYYLIGGGDPNLRSSGAGTLVLWDGLCDAGRRGLSFDFEGSMLPNVEKFFRGFGARQEAFLRVSKGSPIVRTAISAYKTIRS